MYSMLCDCVKMIKKINDDCYDFSSFSKFTGNVGNLLFCGAGTQTEISKLNPNGIFSVSKKYFKGMVKISTSTTEKN